MCIRTYAALQRCKDSGGSWRKTTGWYKSHYLRGLIFFPFRITGPEDKSSPNPGSFKVQLIISQLKGIFTSEGKKSTLSWPLVEFMSDL